MKVGAVFESLSSAAVIKIVAGGAARLLFNNCRRSLAKHLLIFSLVLPYLIRTMWPYLSVLCLS